MFVLAVGVFGYKVMSAGNKITTTERSILGQISDLLFSQGKELKGEQDNRINILLIAIGGEGHQGQNLADTIMIASVEANTGKVALLSIPRDLYVKVPNEEYYSKINAVHAYGESRKASDGPKHLKQIVEEVTGQPIHYYGRVDFKAFKQIVDAVGGIDVTINNSFFDYWHKIAFPAGTEHMNGERTLAYVRARYIEGPEGGDFKRAERQQLVLLALREKIFSVNTALDFTTLNSILNSVSNNVRTDMELWELKRFYELARQVGRDNIHSAVLTSGSKGVLVGTTEILGGSPASVLKTRTGDYSEIRQIAANIFNETNIVSPTPQSASESPVPTTLDQQEDTTTPPVPVKASVEIRNGTNITGLAKKYSEELSTERYEVIGLGNAANRQTSSTVVYILDEDYAEAAKTLAETISATTSSDKPNNETTSEASLLVILGTDADK